MNWIVLVQLLRAVTYIWSRHDPFFKKKFFFESKFAIRFPLVPNDVYNYLLFKKIGNHTAHVYFLITWLINVLHMNIYVKQVTFT